MKAEVRERAEKVRLLILDVDGVLTDGTIILDGDRGEWKAFHVRDGTGIRMLLEAGIEVAFFSGRSCRVVERRAEELGVRHVYQGLRDKVTPYEALKGLLELRDEEVCFVGDDILDVPLLKKVGLPIVVADAVEEAKGFALYVTQSRGGKGAVREVCELILKAQSKWPGSGF